MTASMQERAPVREKVCGCESNRVCFFGFETSEVCAREKRESLKQNIHLSPLLPLLAKVCHTIGDIIPPQKKSSDAHNLKLESIE